MQLRFRCPECDLSGLTPEMDDEKAIRFVLRQLRMRCPACSGIVEATEPLGGVLLQLAAGRLESMGRSLSEEIREAVQAELGRQTASKGKAQPPGKDSASAGTKE